MPDSFVPVDVAGLHIACVGAGYVGGPTATIMAERCPGLHVTVADISAGQIAAWNDGPLPVHEPGLEAAVAAVRGRNLTFTTDVAAAVAAADIVLLAVNTPTKTAGVGAGAAADLRAIEAATRAIAAAATGHTIVVEKSTVPVHTAKNVARLLAAGGAPGATFTVLSNPEFLAEGTALEDLRRPSRVLIGGPPGRAGDAAVARLASVYARWVPTDRILTTNTWSSELAKLVANALLAQRVSSINAVSALCEATGADVREVAAAAGTDPRIGPHFLKAGVGWGGSCFQKDVLSLVYLCEERGLDEAAAYWRQVVTLNDWQKARFTRRMVTAMFGTVTGKRIALLGFAFKKDTGDTRDTPAATVVAALLVEGARVAVYDPAVTPTVATAELQRVLPPDSRPGLLERLEFCDSAEAAGAGASALAVLTEWDAFKTLDFVALHAGMRKPAFLFDGRNLLDHAALRELGFEVHGIGVPAGAGTDRVALHSGPAPACLPPFL